MKKEPDEIPAMKFDEFLKIIDPETDQIYVDSKKKRSDELKNPHPGPAPA